MKRLYICGAISENPNYKEDFETAFSKLIEAGYSEILDPMRFCKDLETWEECMRKCLIILSEHRNLGLAIIETPYKSKGVELELQVAKAFGYEIKTIDEWVEAIK